MSHKFTFGDEVVALKSNTIRQRKNCVEIGERYIVREVEPHGYGVYLDHCSASDECHCTASWWDIANFRIYDADEEDDSRPITPNDLINAHVLPSVDDVAKLFGVKS